MVILTYKPGSAVLQLGGYRCHLTTLNFCVMNIYHYMQYNYTAVLIPPIYTPCICINDLLTVHLCMYVTGKTSTYICDRDDPSHCLIHDGIMQAQHNVHVASYVCILIIMRAHLISTATQSPSLPTHVYDKYT